MPTIITIRLRKQYLFPCLALCGGLGLLVIPAHSQPAAAHTERLIESVEQDWRNLRQTTGAQEFLDPQGTITRYQKFYETEGFRSGQTTVEITGIIAQLYWQGLHDPQKALSIYDWGLQNFVHYPLYNSLQQGRAAIAQAGTFESTFDVSPVDITPDATTANTKNLQPVIVGLPAKVLMPAAGVNGTKQVEADGATKVLSPVTVNSGQTAEVAIAPTNNPFAPVTVMPLANEKTATQNSLTVIPSSTVISANAGIQYGSKSTYSAVTVTNPNPQAGPKAFPRVEINPNDQMTSKVLSPVEPGNASLVQRPGDNAVLSPIIPPAPFIKEDHALSGIDVRQLQLINDVVPIRKGKMSIDTFLSHDNPTAQEALWLLSAHHVIVQWKPDKPLRLALIGVIEGQDPQLLQTPAKLPQPTLLALAEYYAAQRNPQAADVYKILISQEFAPDSWFSKLYVMNNLAEFYGAMGEFDKAAQAKLAIQKQTTDEAWIGNMDVEAARFYMQAGETDKAQALYEKAEKSSYGWAVGVALIDEGRTLIAQHKYDDAIKVLSMPVKGMYADQIEPVKRMMVGGACYQSGDLLKAKENIQAAITMYQALKAPLEGEGVQGMFTSARKSLQRIDQWIKEPIQIDPNEVHISVNATQLQNGPIITRLQVRTFRDAPLTVKTDNKDVTAQILPIIEWNETEGANANQLSEKEVIIKIIAIPQRNVKALLTISSTRYVGYQAQVPVYLEVAGK